MPNFISLESTTSTMQAARDLLDIQDKITQDIIITSPHQTAGRGRQGRTWKTARGNLAMTICTPINVHAFDPRIAFVVGLAICKSIQDILNADIKIKWPNDLLIDGRKVSGVLIEKYKSYLLVGIGVNIVTHPNNLAATHLKAYDVTISHDQLARNIYKNFISFKNTLARKGFACIRQMWLEKAAFLGQEISIHHPENAKKISGKFTGIDLQGAIMLQCHLGKIVKIYAGDVFPAL